MEHAQVGAELLKHLPDSIIMSQGHAQVGAELLRHCQTPSAHPWLVLCRNCTFLTVEREPFEEIFGAYFQGRLQQAKCFFQSMEM
jgi:hypothetical protein